MGLLDDAIKEHLELKRRHGADPTEVARLEHEALGPARREPAAATASVEEAPAVEEQAHDEASFYDDEDPGYSDEVTAEERLEAPRYRHKPEPAPPVVEDEPEVAAPAPEDEPEELDQPTAAFSLEELEAQSREREAPPREPEPEPPAREEPEPHADVVPADDEPDSDDVLEETPEHDRLWFEQKPPRDFDF